MKADQIVPPTDRGNARLTVLTWIAGAAVVFPVISECAFYFLPHSSEEGPDRALLAVEIVLWASSIVALTILVGCLVARLTRPLIPPTPCDTLQDSEEVTEEGLFA